MKKTVFLRTLLCVLLVLGVVLAGCKKAAEQEVSVMPEPQALDEQQEGLTECDVSGTPGMIRVSFGIYNTEEEVDEFLKILDEALEICREEITAFNPEY